MSRTKITYYLALRLRTRMRALRWLTWGLGYRILIKKKYFKMKLLKILMSIFSKKNKLFWNKITFITNILTLNLKIFRTMIANAKFRRSNTISWNFPLIIWIFLIIILNLTSSNLRIQSLGTKKIIWLDYHQS